MAPEFRELIPPDQHEFEADRVLRPLLAIVVATFVLYYAREMLIPLAMAGVLGIVLSPAARQLERLVGRALGAAVVVIGAVAVIAGIIYFLTTELTSVAAEVAGYSSNIAEKVVAIESTTPSWLQQVQAGIADLQEELRRARPSEHHANPKTVAAAPAASPVNEVMTSVTPLLTVFAQVGLTIMLMFFLLYSRRDLRQRLVRLSGRAGMNVAARAVDTASSAVSRYFLLFTLINLGYGIATGLILWLLGMPSPELWGMIGFLLRFIPYIGAITSSVIPTMVAFAIFPGWAMTFEVFATFVAIDQIAGQLIEPFLIGHGIGISPVALLISAVYWSWVWGPVGLILATPLTACIKVAGDHIPALGFFSLLLGVEEAPDDAAKNGVEPAPSSDPETVQ